MDYFRRPKFGNNLLDKVFEVMDIKVLAGLREEWMKS